MNLSRLETLIGSEYLEKIKHLKVLIVGIGGVGGYAFESLVRCGVNNITIIDADKIDSSNLNRQIITNTKNIGCSKVKEAEKRALEINPEININSLELFLSEDNIDLIDFNNFDYVVDACDTVKTKVLLIEKSINSNVKIISSMGTAKKMNAEMLKITTLDKTNYDPLAKVMRKLVDKKIQNRVVVVSSTESVNSTLDLGSNSFVPGVAGLLITNYIINDILAE